ncbi:YfdX family protein [Roseibium algae]|uniref:YfdX family protein n=1 Tax=Roseibium algae TaxID=3123038 RepID=A0ABU8TGH9_9HYPH
MTTKKATASLVALALLGGIATSSAAVYAAEAAHQPAKTVQAQAATDKAIAKDFLALSDDGMAAVGNVHAARMAIYNGDTEAAAKFLQTAQTLTANAEKDATTLDKITKTDIPANGEAAARFIPLNAQISVEDDYALKPEATGHLQKANAAMKAGDTKAAIQHAALVDENVNYTYVSVPYDVLKTNVDKAAQDLKDQKFQNANLALKAVEDSIVFNQMTVENPA